MNPFNPSEEDVIKKLLEETAQGIEPNAAFTAQLEKRLKGAHKPKAGFTMLTVKKIASPIGWGLALLVLALAFNWIASQIAPKTIPAAQIPFLCPVSIPNGNAPPGENAQDANYLGNDELWTTLWPDGKIYMTPADQTTDGSFSTKWPWWRGVNGTLSIEGHRLDEEAEPLRAEIPEGYGNSGFQVSGLIFPTTGCWEVTGHVGDSSLTFVTEVIYATATPQPQPFISDATPVPADATPTGQLYEWNGQSVYLNAVLPESPSEMKIYLPKDEIPATVEDVRALGLKFGMDGEIYEVPGEIGDSVNYLMVDGNQQLRVRSDRYFMYYPDYAESMHASHTQPTPDQKGLIDEFMQTHGLGSEYRIEYSELYESYLVLPLTPDGFAIRQEHFAAYGYMFGFNANGIVRVSSNLLGFDEVTTGRILNAAEALEKLLGPIEIPGVTAEMYSASQQLLSWQHVHPLDQTITYYGFLSSTARSISGGPALILLDGYPVTGNFGNIPEDMPNTYVEVIGQFHQSGDVKTFELETWTIYDGYEEGYVGSIEQRDGEIVFTSPEVGSFRISDLPADMPLPQVDVFITGHSHDGELDWKEIQNQTMGGGGGGGGGMGFYNLNLSGTAVPLPTPIPPAESAAPDAAVFEKQRGIITVTLFDRPDGTQSVLYALVMRDGDHPYVILEGDGLEALQAHHNRPVDIWGRGDHLDNNGTLVVHVERFEIPYPDLKFQILRGSEENILLEGNDALIFTDENGTSYVQLAPNCHDTIGPQSVSGSGEPGQQVLLEALMVPDLSYGGYPALCVFSSSMAVNPQDGQPMDLTITADQPYTAEEGIGANFSPPVMFIEKVELTYFSPDRRYYPGPDPTQEPPYLQPVWRFSGHYSDGSAFEFMVQALTDEYLAPQTQGELP